MCRKASHTRLCCPLCRSSFDSLIPEKVRSKVADTIEEEVALICPKIWKAAILGNLNCGRVQVIEPEVITLRIEQGVINSAESAELSP